MLLRSRCSLLLIATAIIAGLLSVPLVQAAQQFATRGSYSCGVDNPTSTQCLRKVDPKPIDCVQTVNPTTGAVSYSCKVREPQKKTMLQISDVFVTKDSRAF